VSSYESKLSQNSYANWKNKRQIKTFKPLDLQLESKDLSMINLSKWYWMWWLG